MQQLAQNTQDLQLSWMALADVMDRTIDALVNADTEELTNLLKRCEEADFSLLCGATSMRDTPAQPKHAMLGKLLAHTRTNLSVLRHVSAFKMQTVE